MECDLRSVFAPLIQSLANLSEELREEDIEQILREIRHDSEVMTLEFNFRSRKKGTASTWLGDEALRFFVQTASHNIGASGFSRLQMDESWARMKFYFLLLPRSAENATYLSASGVERMVAMVPTPVGGYGAEFSRRLQLTTAVLHRLISTRMTAEISTAFAAHQDLLLASTARGREQRSERSVPTTLREGTLSLEQAISLLLADPIESLSYRDALRELVKVPQIKVGGCS